MRQGNKKARIGIIGAGFWCTANHLPILHSHPDVELSAVARLGTTELHQLKEKYGFPIATENYLELFDNTELDGVIVASPHQLNYLTAAASD